MNNYLNDLKCGGRIMTELEKTQKKLRELDDVMGKPVEPQKGKCEIEDLEFQKSLLEKIKGE